MCGAFGTPIPDGYANECGFILISIFEFVMQKKISKEINKDRIQSKSYITVINQFNCLSMENITKFLWATKGKCKLK